MNEFDFEALPVDAQLLLFESAFVVCTIFDRFDQVQKALLFCFARILVVFFGLDPSVLIKLLRVLNELLPVLLLVHHLMHGRGLANYFPLFGQLLVVLGLLHYFSFDSCCFIALRFGHLPVVPAKATEHARDDGLDFVLGLVHALFQ